jgi:nucleotide-binding universal stress UspA family protein
MISTVAVGTDGSDTAREAVRMAAELAGRFGAELVLVSAFSDSDRTPVDRRAGDAELQWAFSSSARLREMLSRTEDELRLEGIRCRTLVDEGDPGAVLVQLAGDCGADVLVIGNKGMHRRVLGSVPNTITHQAPCTVLVVKTT